MKQEKSYEEKIADIKKYLQERENDVAKNKIQEDQKQVIRSKLDNEGEDIPLKVSDLSSIRKKIQYDEEIRKTKKSPENKGLKSENIDQKSPKWKSEEKSNLTNKKILNILLLVFLLFLPLFATLSVISFNSTYLIREPFNYFFYALSGVSIIGIICVSLLKIVNRDKLKDKIFKYVMASLIVVILDILFMILFIAKKMWSLLDVVLAHKKIFIIIILLLVLVLISLIIIKCVKHIKIKHNIKNMFITIFMTIYIVCFVDLWVILYGPAQEFKEWLITTAMQTMHHQYFCKWFYSEKDIEYILSQNYVLESGESTDPSLIKIEQEEVIEYENEYEEAVLKKDHKDDLYKIISLDVNGCKGYLAVIYDPKTVHVAVTQHVGSYGQYVTTMAKNANAVLGINGGGFYDPGNTSPGGTPTGITIVDGEIVTNGEYGTNVQTGGIIGFDTDGVLHLLKDTTAKQALEMGITDAVSWGPFLIVNGKPSFIKGNGGWGYAARTAIGQRADGIVLMLVVDSNTSRTNGADMVDLTEIMQTYGAVNAANLDGGTSSVMVMPKDKALEYNSNCDDDYCNINDPIDGALRHQTRAIADAFVVVPNK